MAIIHRSIYSSLQSLLFDCKPQQISQTRVAHSQLPIHNIHLWVFEI